MNKSRSLKLAAAMICQLSLAVCAFASSQSPIDFTPGGMVHTTLPGLDYNYPDSDIQVINNGSPGTESTVKANLLGTDASLTLSGITYHLLQFHFHTESEHLLDGGSFPMELHLVHQIPGSDPNTNLLVTGRWIVEGAENPALAGIFDHLPSDPAGYALTDFNLAALLPPTLESYRYSGSLTTPDYNGPVQWVFLNTPLEMSAGQIQAFRSLFPSGNAREAQPLDGRVVLTDVVPEPGIPGLCGIGAVLALARRRRHPAVPENSLTSSHIPCRSQT